MGVMAGFCSSDLVYGNRGLSGNGAALLKYNGLRPLENKQMAASARNPSGSFASSSECHSLHHCCIGLRRNAKATRCKERLKGRLAAHIQTRCMYVGHPVHSSGEDVMRLITVFLRDNYSKSAELFGLLTELPRIYEGPVKAVATPTIAAPKRETDPKKRIVITGMGLVSVFGNDIDTFYNKLLEGESGISTIDRFDASTFSVRFAGQIRDFSSKGYIDGKNDRRLDDCWRYCLVAGRRALEDAELSPDILENMDKSRIGVLVGTGMGGLTAFSNGVESLIQKGYKKITPFFIPYSITNMGSALLAIDTGLMGPNYSISTACATANYCFYAAANHIRRGEADIMVAGGTEAAVLPTGVGGFIACRALSQRNDEPEKASRPWDKDRDGFVMGEGSGVLVMESLEHARNRGANIIAEYLGGAITCDAHHMTDPRSDGLGVSSCIIKSLEDAGVSPEEVNYVNAHATSTLAGDLAEVNAIKKVFKDTSEMKMNGTKSMIGHCLGAAGGLEAIATIKAITTGWLHPTINQFNLEPDVSIDTVPNTKKKHDVHVAISNSFGFGGHNSVVVFAPFTP